MRPQFTLIADQVNNMDQLTIKIEISDEMFSDYDRGVEYFQHKAAGRIEDTLAVKARIRFVGPNSLERKAGKTVRVADNRAFA